MSDLLAAGQAYSRTQISVTLPRDRARPGRLWLIVEGMVALRDVPCLGKADNGMAGLHKNPSRQPIYPYGDTPAGSYRCVTAVTHDPPHKRMGRFSIALLGIQGDARTAMINRSGLAIHGGPDLPRYDDPLALVPTFGCLRLANRDMEMLVAKLHGLPVSIEIEEEPLDETAREAATPTLRAPLTGRSTTP